MPNIILDREKISQPLTKTSPDVTILTAMGEEAAIDAKEAPRG